MARLSKIRDKGYFLRLAVCMYFMCFALANNTRLRTRLGAGGVEAPPPDTRAFGREYNQKGGHPTLK